MELVLGQQQIQYKKQPSADEIIEKINELLVNGYFFSHFIVDGKEIYEDHEEYLNLNLDGITKLEVIAKTEKEFMNDIHLSAEDYLKRVGPELVILSEGFHSNPTSQTWTDYELLFGGVEWLYDMLTLIGRSEERLANWESYVSLSNEMQEILMQLGQAVEKNNYMQTGNILRDRLIQNFEAFEIAIKKTNDEQGIRPNLH
ncbi:hypothetical protein [Sporosarcina sp. NPDC096371]|uniref:hypothetical protein n=1 Tax=Sporosarcina sp. NPDC096371 TaxID=3364530 RepID=UPI0038070DCD